MPTADTYWSAAADFDRLAGDAAARSGQLSRAPELPVVGPLETVLRSALDEVASGLGTSAAGYRTLAEECRRRAVACAAYTSALASYQRAVAAYADADDTAHDAPTRPRPPHRESWMSAG